MKVILRKEYKNPNRKGPAIKYIVEDEEGNKICQRNSDRKYVACLLVDTTGEYNAWNYFGRINLIGIGWNNSVFRYIKGNNIKYIIAYDKESIIRIIKDKYTDFGLQEALIEADKYAFIEDKYCNNCNKYYPSFKDENHCLICQCI